MGGLGRGAVPGQAGPAKGEGAVGSGESGLRRGVRGVASGHRVGRCQARSESEDKRLEEMAREWLTGRSVHGVTEGCTFLAGEINTSLADLSELLGQVRREERERGTVRLRYKTAKFTQEEESRSVNARLLDEALLRLSEVEAERDAAFSGRQHEDLLRGEAEGGGARAARGGP